MRGRGFDDEPSLIEPAQDAAEIAVIEAELGGDVCGSRLLAVCEFVKDASFGQGKRTFQKVVAQHADTAGVGPVEAPDGAHALVKRMIGHGNALILRVCANIKELCDFVKYLLRVSP
jgi:hypothetical protein